MAHSILPNRFTRQPQYPCEIDRGNPLAHGMIGYFTNFGVPTINGRTNFVSHSGVAVTSPLGRGFDYSGTQLTRFPNGAMPVIRSTHEAGMALLILCDVDTLTNYSHVIAYQNAPGGAGWEFRIGLNASDSRLMLERGNSSTYSQSVASASDTISAPARNQTIIAWAPSAIAVDATFVVNGTLYNGTGAAGSGNIGDTTGDIYIGRRSDGATQLDGRIYLIAVWARQLSLPEARALTANPWQLFRPIQRRIYASDGGAPEVPPFGGQLFVLELE